MRREKSPVLALLITIAIAINTGEAKGTSNENASREPSKVRSPKSAFGKDREESTTPRN